ncbi:DDE-type integrase/transposase/recombinase [Ruegeria conchae]|uniref:DDE-type integrase/transposase/recombinase n=1 Tax=Ruegeria conchae TaxID=981384 RepID=UPI00398449B2
MNNMIEQDHQFIKRRVRHMCGFKSFASASATLDGIEVATMTRKQQFSSAATSGFRGFAEIVG